MTSGKVSIIIPAYNQGDYVAEAIQSGLDQTYPDVELIIVNDGSTDDTEKVVSRYPDRRIRYVYQENRGLSAARNTGLRLATGAYLTFLDADDRFLLDKIAVLASLFADRPNLGFVSGQTIATDQAARRLGVLNEKTLPDNPLDLIFGNTIQVGSVLVRREWIERVGVFDEGLKACEDWDLWLRLIQAGCEMACVAAPVAFYRMHSGQMTRGVDRMRTAMLAVLGKIFASENIPEYWQARRDRAYAAVYIRAAMRAYLAGQAAQARQDLVQAVQLDPSIIENDGEPLAGQLIVWANAPWVEKPLDALKYIYHYLPGELACLQKRRRKHLAALALEIAYRHQRESSPAKMRQYMYQAILNQPSRLINRGILSTLVRSYLGS